MAEFTNEELFTSNDILRYNYGIKPYSYDIACKWKIKNLPKKFVRGGELCTSYIGMTWTTQEYVIDEGRVRFYLSLRISAQHAQNLFFSLYVVFNTRVKHYDWKALIVSRKRGNREIFQSTFNNKSKKLPNIQWNIIDYVLPDHSLTIFCYIKVQSNETKLDIKPKIQHIPKATNNIQLVNAQGTTSPAQKESPIIEIEDNDIEMPIDQEFVKEHIKKMKTLVDDSSTSDISLISSDKKQIYAHRTILNLRSSAFKDLYKNTCSSKIEIKDVNYDTLKVVLNFIYTGELENICVSQAANILQAAEKYQIEGLKAKCQHILLENLSIKNAVETLIHSELYKIDILKDAAINIIIKNVKSFNEAQFQEIADVNGNLLVKILTLYSQTLAQE